MSETPRRIYVLKHKNGPIRLIDSTNPARALMFVARDEWSIRVASPRDIVALRNTPIEKATNDLLVPEPGE